LIQDSDAPALTLSLFDTDTLAAAIQAAAAAANVTLTVAVKSIAIPTVTSGGSVSSGSGSVVGPVLGVLGALAALGIIGGVVYYLTMNKSKSENEKSEVAVVETEMNPVILTDRHDEQYESVAGGSVAGGERSPGPGVQEMRCSPELHVLPPEMQNDEYGEEHADHDEYGEELDIPSTLLGATTAIDAATNVEDVIYSITGIPLDELDTLVFKYFSRYDIDGSLTLNTNDELHQLLVNLCYKLTSVSTDSDNLVHMTALIEEKSSSVTLDYHNGWTVDDFREWFYDEIVLQQPAGRFEYPPMSDASKEPVLW